MTTTVLGPTRLLVGELTKGAALWVVSGAGAPFGFGAGVEESFEGVGLGVEALGELVEDEVAPADGFILETALSSPVSWTDQKP